MMKKPPKVLKTCRIEHEYIDYCTMQGLNFNGIVNALLKGFCKSHQRNALFRQYWKESGVNVELG